MLLTSVSESIAFFLGALTPMPAVRLFSLYAAVSVLIDFLLQITVFVTFITLDHKRTLESRVDVLCCLRVSPDEPSADRRRRSSSNSWLNCFRRHSTDENTQDLTPAQVPLTSSKSDASDTGRAHRKENMDPCEEHLMEMDGFLFGIFKRYYAPFVMNRHVRPAVIFIFFTWLTASIALLPYVKVGLEQDITMPKDSYMIDYFSALKEYLAVGPPVYFVIKQGRVENDTLVVVVLLLNRIEYSV